MNRLKNEEVLHVANLAKLELNEKEVEKFSYQLKSIMDEIDKINDVKVESEDILISPCKNECYLREDEGKEADPKMCKELIENAPSSFDAYIEVRGVFND